MNIKNKKFILLVIYLLSSLATITFAAEQIADSTELIQLDINQKKYFDSEVYFLEQKSYFPLLQIAELLDIPVNRDYKTGQVSFISIEDGSNVIIDEKNNQITAGNSILDTSQNNFYLIKRGFVINDDILVEKDLLEKFFKIKLNIDKDSLTASINIDRQINLLKEKIKFTEKSTETYIQPEKEKFNLRTLNIHSRSNSKYFDTSSSSSSSSRMEYNSYLDFNFSGKLNEGNLSIGPRFMTTDQGLYLKGFNHSWKKYYDENFGISIGTTNLQFSKFSLPNYNLYGLIMGNPKLMNLNKKNYLSFEGDCINDSEILLNLNDKQIARQICKNNKYNFTNIPRLMGIENKYQIKQRTTSNEESVLREESNSYYADMIIKGETDWIFGIGTSQPRVNMTVYGKEDENQNIDYFLHKVLLGGYVLQGLKDNLNIGAAVVADPFFKKQDLPETKNIDLTPSFTHSKGFSSGATSSIFLNYRPKTNLKINWEAALGYSKDASQSKIYREGSGYASSISYNWKNKEATSSGSLYYLSPFFYSPSNVQPNQMGYEIFNQFHWKNQNFSLSAQKKIANLDQQSMGGLSTNQQYNFSHFFNLFGGSFSNQNTLKYVIAENQINSFSLFDISSSPRQKIMKNLYGNLGFAGSKSESLTENGTSLSRNYLSTNLGLDYNFKYKNFENQISPSFLMKTNGSRTSTLQLRSKKKKLSYQGSFRANFNQDDPNAKQLDYYISNGLFYEKDNGMRFGVEYIYSNNSMTIMNPNSNMPDQINQSNKTNHSLLISSASNIGFFDKKIHVLANANAGYLKGFFFIDINENEKQDASEKGIPDALIQISPSGKEAKTDQNGFFTIPDLAPGKYKAILNIIEMPITLTMLSKSSLPFEIKSGGVTEVKFRTKLSSGYVYGKIDIRDKNNKQRPISNIVIVATDTSTEKEVAYTYTDGSGNYVLSELKPGEYIISVDSLDISKRRLLVQKSPKKIKIPIKIEDVYEIHDADFEIIESLFGS